MTSLVLPALNAEIRSQQDSHTSGQKSQRRAPVRTELVTFTYDRTAVERGHTPVISICRAHYLCWRSDFVSRSPQLRQSSVLRTLVLGPDDDYEPSLDYEHLVCSTALEHESTLRAYMEVGEVPAEAIENNSEDEYDGRDQDDESGHNAQQISSHEQTGTHSRSLPIDRFIPSNVRASPFFHDSEAGYQTLQSLLRLSYPDATPPPGTFVVVQAIWPDYAKVSHFGGDDPQTLDSLRIGMNPFTTVLLIDIIESQGFVPDIDVDKLHFVRPIESTIARIDRHRAIVDSRRGGTAQQAVETITQLTERTLQSENFVCDICKADVQVGEAITGLPCGHFVGHDCAEYGSKSASPGHAQCAGGKCDIIALSLPQPTTVKGGLRAPCISSMAAAA